jgi:hypothetical protein
MDASFVMVGVVSSWCYPDTIAEAKRGMATIPQVKPKKAQIIDEAAAKISQILEEHFDEQGWSEDERNRRASGASARVAAAVARRAKSA